MGSECKRGVVLKSEKSVGRRLNFSIDRHTAVFQTEIFAILTCGSEIQKITRPDDYINTGCNKQATLETPQAVETSSPLVPQCQMLKLHASRDSTGSADMLTSAKSSQGKVLLTSFFNQGHTLGSRGRILCRNHGLAL
jgi:hypothetical protein